MRSRGVWHRRKCIKKIKRWPAEDGYGWMGLKLSGQSVDWLRGDGDRRRNDQCFKYFDRELMGVIGNAD